MSKEIQIVETTEQIKEPDYLAELQPELDKAYSESIQLKYSTGTLQSANDEEWYVILLEEKLLIIDGRACFRGKGSASQRLRSFVNNNQYAITDTIRKRLGYDPNKYPNPDWNGEKEQLAQKLSKQYRDMWKDENTKVLSLKEYRENYPLAEI